MPLPQRKEKREDGGFHRPRGILIFFGLGMTLTGLDVLAHEGFSRLRGGRIGLVTHSAAVDRAVQPALPCGAGRQGHALVGAVIDPHVLVLHDAVLSLMMV